MLNFTLPNFVENNRVNNILYALVRGYPEKLKYKDIAIQGQCGPIPYCSWNGGINNNVGNGLYYPQLVQLQQETVTHRLNFANVMLEDYDYYDNLGQTVLKIFDDGSSKIEISSIPLMEKIQEQYPNYNFMFSKWADLITPFTPELLNNIAESERFCLIGIPDRYTFNLDWLSQLSHKRLFEITVNPFCTKCDKYASCYLCEQENQLNYSGKSIILDCSKHEGQAILPLEEIVKNYKSKGFINFTFALDYNINMDQILSNYIVYFFKPEEVNFIMDEAKRIATQQGGEEIVNG